MRLWVGALQVRTAGQQTLAAALAAMLGRLDDDAKGTHEFGQLAGLLEQFGGLEGASAVCVQCGAPLDEEERRRSRGTCTACYASYIAQAKRTLGARVTEGVYDDSPGRTARTAAAAAMRQRGFAAGISGGDARE